MDIAASEIAVFIDRDGTINVDVDHLSSPEQLHFIPRSIAAIRELNELQIKVIVITNQSGIARRYFSEDDVRAVHQAMSDELAKHGASVTDYFYCPHHPSDGFPPYIRECECRKPKPGMLLDAKKKYHLDLQHSFVVGDKCIDVQTGKAVGALSIQVSTGYGADEKEMCAADRDYFAEDLFDAVQFIKKILSQRKK